MMLANGKNKISKRFEEECIITSSSNTITNNNAATTMTPVLSLLEQEKNKERQLVLLFFRTRLFRHSCYMMLFYILVLFLIFFIIGRNVYSNTSTLNSFSHQLSSVAKGRKCPFGFTKASRRRKQFNIFYNNNNNIETKRRLLENHNTKSEYVDMNESLLLQNTSDEEGGVLLQLESNWSEEQYWEIKLDRIWNETKKNPHLPNQYPSLSEYFFRLLLIGDDFTRLRLPLTFRPYSNRVKLLHSTGSFAKIRLRWTDTLFRTTSTGLFSEPYIDGILSGSGGNPFVGNQSVAYGWGMKFFRTNAPPASILTLNAFFGGGAYWNIFGYMTCNHASLVEMSALGPALAGWSRFPNQNGLKTMALYNLNGTLNDKPNFPYALCFVPNLTLRDRIGEPSLIDSKTGLRNNMSGMHAQLAQIQRNEKLADIIAIMHPKVLSNPRLLYNLDYARYVGDIHILEPFRRSQYGDSRLFFQHQPFEDDLILKPDWTPYMTLDNMFREGSYGVYRTFFPPPNPQILEQLRALNTLVEIITKLFQQPLQQSQAVSELLGVQSFITLLRHYITQGGSIPLPLLLTGDPAFPPSLHQSFQNGFKQAHRFMDLIKSIQPTFIEWMQQRVEQIEYYFLHLTPESRNNVSTEKPMYQNEWPKSVATTTKNHEHDDDPFISEYLRYLNLSHGLRQYYSTLNTFAQPSSSSSIVSTIYDALTTLPVMSIENSIVLPSTILWGHVKKTFSSFFLRNTTFSKQKILENSYEMLSQDIPKDVFARTLVSYVLNIMQFLNNNNSKHVMMHKTSEIFSKKTNQSILDNYTEENYNDYSYNNGNNNIQHLMNRMAEILQPMDYKLIIMHFVVPTYWGIVGQSTIENQKNFENFIGNVMNFKPYSSANKSL